MNQTVISSSLFFLILTCLFSFPATVGSSDNLTKGESININLGVRSKTLVSANERFELGFFNPDGKRNCWFLSIWYYNLRPLTPVWVANPQDPITARIGGQFNFLPNGSVALRDGRGDKTYFMVGNSSFKDSQTTLTLMNSGNLVLTSNVSGGIPILIWQSFENPSDTFLPGMKMTGKLKLTSWVPKCEGNISGDKPLSNFTLEMNNDDIDTLVIKNQSSTIWKIPQSFYGSHTLFNPVYELLLNRSVNYNSTSTRIVMSSTGQIQFWNMSMNSSTVIWSAPENNCSKFEFCGKYASCNNENIESPCRCLPGFKQLDSSNDCSQSQQLCIDGGKDDKFAKLKVKKVIRPDTPYDQAQDEAACEKECRSNCKCNAYAYETASRSPTDKDEVQVQGNGCLIWYNDITDLEEESSTSDKVIHVRFRAPNYRQCVKETCGYNLIPYPLRAGGNCGDPNYSDFSCETSTEDDQLKFTIGNLSFPVTRIDEEDHSFDLHFPNKSTCNNIVDNLRITHGKKYHVLPNSSCDSSSSLKIIWDPPPEPICNSGDEDCEDWPNSTCKNHTNNNGEKRCICNPNYKWNGTSLSCTTDAGDPSSTKPSKLKIIVVITVVTAGSGILLLVLTFFGYRRTINRRRKRRESDERIERLYNTEKRVKDLMDTREFNEEDKKGIDVPFFDLKTILEATNYFSDENKLGEGGFGPVYKGIFPGGQEIAVKRLSSKSVQGLEEFKNEVVLIAKLQHRNLVRLLGYCVKGDEKILLYEYMKNRSLDAFIFDRTLCLTMDWKKRFEIIMGIARGLLYLHQDSRLRIIHRDLKTSNVLLDDEMNPKISDFGLARIVGGSETQANTMRIVGTYGYMSPEYALEGLFSIKSDIFSFGVIVLEIISGRRNTGFYDSHRALNLLGYAWNLWLEDNIHGLMDKAMPVESCNRGEVLRCINVGLLCVQEDPGDRPTMSNVVFTLGNETATLPIPKQPAFVVKKWLPNDESSSSSKPEISSSNKLTCTMEEGR